MMSHNSVVVLICHRLLIGEAVCLVWRLGKEFLRASVKLRADRAGGPAGPRTHKASHQHTVIQRPFLQSVYNNSPSALPDTDEALNSPCLLSQQAEVELMSSLSSPEWSITSCNYK